MRQKVEPTFDPLPTVAEPGEQDAPAPVLQSDGPLRHVRVRRWREAGAGAAGWAALGCVALMVALPDVSEEVVVALTRPPATIADVETTGAIVPVQKGIEAVPRAPVFAMSLGRGPSADRLWLRWTNLSARNASLLRDVAPLVKPAPADPESFVLLAGGYETEDAARRACEAVKARFVACDVATLDGTVVPEPR